MILLTKPYNEASGNALSMAHDVLTLTPPTPLASHAFRESASGSAVAKAVSVIGILTVVRACSRRLRLYEFASFIMHIEHAIFDAMAAARLTAEIEAVIAFPGAAKRTFDRARSLGVICVLNGVNGTPDDHNAAIDAVSKSWRVRHERIPPWVARRVRAEVERADLVLSPSDMTRRRILSSYEDRADVSVQRYGFRERKDFPAHERRSSVLYVGQISVRKGVPLLLEIAREMPDIRFDLVGPIVTRGLLSARPPNVFYLGETDESAVATHMSSSGCLVLPSGEDSFGLVVVEALSYGTPVVVSSRAGASELAERVAGMSICDPRDGAKTWMRAIRGLLIENISAELIRQDLRRAVRSWPEYASDVIAQIHELT